MKEKRFSKVFSFSSILSQISAYLFLLIISAFVVAYYIDPWIEKSISKTDLVVEIFETVFTMLLGIGVKSYFQKLVAGNLKEVHKELLEKLGKDSPDNAYLAYHTIITHTQEMKKLVNKLVNLPQHPKLMKLLIEDYSKKAENSKFLVDFPTFLKLAEILVENSKEMCFVNTTPPYEWWYPIRFEMNKEIEDAIRHYKEKIEAKLNEGSKISRITIIEKVENKQNTFDIALTSILEHGFYTYFNTLGININSSNKDDNIVRPIIAWMQSILRSLQPKVTSTNETLNNILEILNSPNSSISRFNSLLSNYWDSSCYIFKDDFKNLSYEISRLILKDFVSLHYPSNKGFYILKDRVSDSRKDDIRNLAKEEGIFKDSAGNMYLLRIEEANGVNVLLVTIRSIGNIDDTYFKRLNDNFINNRCEQIATGKLQDLLENVK